MIRKAFLYLSALSNRSVELHGSSGSSEEVDLEAGLQREEEVDQIEDQEDENKYEDEDEDEDEDESAEEVDLEAGLRREEEVDQIEDREDDDKYEDKGAKYEDKVELYRPRPNEKFAKIRLRNELKLFSGDLPISCTAVPTDGDLFYWETTLKGPADSPYEGGVFHLTFRFPPDYPFKPPEVLFKTKIFHPNIDSKGNICLWKEDWVSGVVTATILVHIYCLLMEPEIDNMAVQEIADMYVKDRFRFEMMARSWTSMYAKGLSSSEPTQETKSMTVQAS